MKRTGFRPPKNDAVKGKCCECRANYGDERNADCGARGCPLYPLGRHNKEIPDYSWVFGKWSKTHETRRRAEGLTQEEYIKKYVVRSDGRRSKLGTTSHYRAKCYSCCGDFHDGRADCEIQDCSIYYWMPYRDKKPTFDWIFDLNYTMRHKQAIVVEGCTREEYLKRHFKDRHPTIKIRRIEVAP